MQNHTYVFGDRYSGKQVAVEAWAETGQITVMMRDMAGDSWGPKLTLLYEEGDPVQIAFELEEEARPETMREIGGR